MTSIRGLSGGIRHGFSRALYTVDGPNRVRVTRPDGAEGLFDGIGRWVEGEVYDVDPEMCLWMSINRATLSHRLSSQVTNIESANEIDK